MTIILKSIIHGLPLPAKIKKIYVTQSFSVTHYYSQHDFITSTERRWRTSCVDMTDGEGGGEGGTSSWNITISAGGEINSEGKNKDLKTSEEKKDMMKILSGRVSKGKEVVKPFYPWKWGGSFLGVESLLEDQILKRTSFPSSSFLSFLSKIFSPKPMGLSGGFTLLREDL